VKGDAVRSTGQKGGSWGLEINYKAKRGLAARQREHGPEIRVQLSYKRPGVQGENMLWRGISLQAEGTGVKTVVQGRGVSLRRRRTFTTLMKKRQQSGARFAVGKPGRRRRPLVRKGERDDETMVFANKKKH